MDATEGTDAMETDQPLDQSRLKPDDGIGQPQQKEGVGDPNNAEMEGVEDSGRR